MSITVLDASAAVPVRLTRPSSSTYSDLRQGAFAEQHVPGRYLGQIAAGRDALQRLAVQLREARHRSQHRFDRLHRALCVTSPALSLYECGGICHRQYSNW